MLLQRLAIYWCNPRETSEIQARGLLGQKKVKKKLWSTVQCETMHGVVSASSACIQCLHPVPTYEFPRRVLHFSAIHLFLQCDRSTAISTYFAQLTSLPIKVGWVGSGCSPATEPTAELTQYHNIIQVMVCARVK